MNPRERSPLLGENRTSSSIAGPIESSPQVSHFMGTSPEPSPVRDSVALVPSSNSAVTLAGLAYHQLSNRHCSGSLGCGRARKKWKPSAHSDTAKLGNSV